MRQLGFIPASPFSAPLPSSSPPPRLNSSHLRHIIKSAGLGAQVAEGYESLPGTGRMRDKSPEGGGLELLSPLTPGFICGGPYYWALQLPCPASLNLFVPHHHHHHKIITLRNNFLLDAVHPKVNSRLADFEEAEGCCSACSHPPCASLLSFPCLACKRSIGK